jgi:tRNA A-37 threonylcarbamoyl transferase component Bud32
VTTIRRLKQAPGRRRGPVCWHGHRRFIATGWEETLAACGLDPEADWTGLAPGVQVSDSKVTNCFRIATGADTSIYFKRYVYTRYKKWRYLLRSGKAATEAFGYRQLAALGIPTLEVVAFDEHRRWGRLVSACIVTRGIARSRDLEDYARHEWPQLDPPRRRRLAALIRDRLLQQLQTTHRAGFFHQDLHWRNLLLVDRGPDDFEIYWIDCPRARYQRLRRGHAQLVDLSTLSRVAGRYLSRHFRVDAVRRFLGDRRPYHRTRRWIRAIARHQQGRRGG